MNFAITFGFLQTFLKVLDFLYQILHVLVYQGIFVTWRPTLESLILILDAS